MNNILGVCPREREREGGREGGREREREREREGGGTYSRRCSAPLYSCESVGLLSTKF